MSKGKPDLALALLEQRLDIEPDNTLLLNKAGLCSILTGAYDQALRYGTAAENAAEASKTLGWNEIYGQARVTCGLALVGLDKPERGLEILRQETSYDSRALRHVIASLNYMEKFPQSQEFIVRYLKREPHSVWGHFMEAKCRNGLGQPERAEAAFAAAVDLSQGRIVNLVSLLQRDFDRTGADFARQKLAQLHKAPAASCGPPPVTFTISADPL